MSMPPEFPKRFSRMWIRLLNLEQTLFPEIKGQLGELSEKEERLIRVLNFANIEQYCCDVQITNPPKDRKEMARAFITKQIYNIHTTRDLMDRLKVGRGLRLLCGWRSVLDIPSESKFSRMFTLLSTNQAAARAHEDFIRRYPREGFFFYHATDSTAIELREKPVKKEKSKPKAKKKQGRPKKGEKRPKERKILEQQQTMESTETRKSHHYSHRSSVERVNAYLKDSYGCQNIYYQGATKVASVLNFAVLSLCIVQSLKLLT